MEFLSVNFSMQARSRIVAAKIKAERLISNPGGISFGHIDGMPDEPQVWIVFRYIMTVFGAVAHEACELGRNGTWVVDEVDRQSQQFLRSFALATRAAHDLPEIVSNMGFVRPVIQKVFESFPQWKTYQDELLEVAELQSRPLPARAPVIVSPPPPPPPVIKPQQGKQRRFLEAKPELLKDKEVVGRRIAAEALGITERTLDRRVEGGDLTPVGQGHYKRFKTSDLRKMLNQKNSDKVDKSRQQ